MSSDNLRLKFPAAFIVEHVYPTAAELVAAYERGWIGPRDIIEVTLAKLKSGVARTAEEESIALLLSDDIDEVDALVEAIRQRISPSGFEPLRVWLYLALAWLWENRSAYGSPHRMIEEIYAQFDYPDEIEHLVDYMPVQPGARVGPDAIDDNWREYLRDQQLDYARRSRSYGPDS
jgi:hypothetical protein